jgi:hypothetical protein
MYTNLLNFFKIIIILVIILVVLAYTIRNYNNSNKSIVKFLISNRNNSTTSQPNKITEKLVQYNSNAYVPIPNKYVVFYCDGWCGGWADRMDGIMGAMALALIQNRTFLIEITQPRLINHALKSNIIKWDVPIINSNKLSVHVMSVIDNFAIRKDLSTLDWTTHLSNRIQTHN